MDAEFQNPISSDASFKILVLHLKKEKIDYEKHRGAPRIERRTFRKTVSKIFRDFSLRLLSQLSYAPLNNQGGGIH